ncbi:protein CASP-like [Asterias rubens]|uniref:protein CASP-like n=1 Tax=Asterias rubens TaxID=7604 RepID=UPI001455671B|nr:protein CASP-like [Asterias rubens]
MIERFTELQAKHAEMVKVVEDQRQLISKLEKDLLSVNSLSTMYLRGEGEGQATPSTTEAGFAADAVRETSTLAKSSSSEGSQGAAESLLPIVSSQRERFRLRNQELEMENRQHQQQVTVLKEEADKLRSDNVKLYEKIRFLQSYKNNKASSGVDDTESRYSTQYEQRLDPFNSFSRKEKQRKYMNLSPFDKATLSMGRLVLANKIARMIAFLYVMILHMLVFLVLYKMAYTSACKRDSATECFAKFQEHMHHFHPGEKDDVGLLNHG